MRHTTHNRQEEVFDFASDRSESSAGSPPFDLFELENREDLTEPDFDAFEDFHTSSFPPRHTRSPAPSPAGCGCRATPGAYQQTPPLSRGV